MRTIIEPLKALNAIAIWYACKFMNAITWFRDISFPVLSCAEASKRALITSDSAQRTQ
jgi:hypothetical protein